MIRNETAQNGVIIYADIIDTATSTVSREENGVIVSTRPFTAEEVERYGPQPLSIKAPYGDESLLATADGEVLAYNGAEWDNRHVLPLDIAISGKYLDTVAGAGYSPRYAGSNVANSNQTMWYPMFVPSSRTFDAIAINCGIAADVASGSLVRLGLYNVDPATSYPTSLIVDAGTVSIESTGLKEATFSSITLTAGWYYTMFSCYAAGVTRPSFHGPSTLLRQIGSAGLTTNNDHFNSHVAISNVAGSIDPTVAAPDPAPAGAVPAWFLSASQALIYTSLRYA
jgi:hypothetical protein